MSSITDHLVNSKEYWNQRFSDDWCEKGGPDQSRFFAKMIMAELPKWIKETITHNQLSICDWGCAEGDGTAEFKKYFTESKVVGVDFAAESVRTAKNRYGHLTFNCENWLSETLSNEKYDVVIASNTLEHFTEPYAVLTSIARVSKAFVIVAVPFREKHLHREHFYSFNEANIPIYISEGFVLVHASVKNCAENDKKFWDGEQIILIYGRCSALNTIDHVQNTNVVLSDAASVYNSRDEQSFISAKTQWESEKLALEQTISELTTKNNEQLSQLTQILNSRSMLVTKPARMIARFCLRAPFDTNGRDVFGRISRKLAKNIPVLQPIYNGITRKILKRKKLQLPFFKPNRVPENQELEDFFIWGVIDWRFRFQRPQQISAELAKRGHVVIYISPNFIDSSEPGFTIEQLDQSGRLFQVRLFLAGAPSIYKAMPSSAALDQLRKSLGELLISSGSARVTAIVQHPFWTNVAAAIPGSRLVYDCMDYHAGFAETGIAIAAGEDRLFGRADLVVTTSDVLDEQVADRTRRKCIVRNGCDFQHFARKPGDVYVDPNGRRVIGYYGAIAEWFDADIVEAVANRNSDCAVLLVGADTAGIRKRLKHLRNVKFTGEVSYAELPYFLHGFDVCMLPFKVVPLTSATNPVKVYEYLSAGKPVVSVNLPELQHFEGLVHVASTATQFADYTRELVFSPTTELVRNKYQDFAKSQTWSSRVDLLKAHLSRADEAPLVSVIIISYNTESLTKACLSSIERNSQYSNVEVIVVDNGSRDGSSSYLEKWEASSPRHKLILNKTNRGFAAANNQGMQVAKGEYLILLNSDTQVTPAWIETLVNHLADNKHIGLLNPVTNNIGNEAKIDISYTNMEQMLEKSRMYTFRHLGHLTPMRSVAFFCVAMARSTYEAVGPLDESFGLGYFEDDDYCRRVEKLGLSLACANDVFVHHELSASFSKLKNNGRRNILETSRKVYEAKWGPWMPHKYRERKPLKPTKLAQLHSNYLVGHCNVCGKGSRFFFTDEKLWRESLVCEHCKSTSRYRSIARGLLQGIHEITRINAKSLAELPNKSPANIRICDTQVPFEAEACAYSLPTILEQYPWISVETTLFRPDGQLGYRIAKNTSLQNLECLTFTDQEFDLFVTSDVMEHVRLDCKAHAEIARVLKPNGIYVFTVPHDMSWEKNQIRVHLCEENNPGKDIYVMPPEYHGDTNSDSGAGCLAYRAYGREMFEQLASVGLEATYTKADVAPHAILNTELFYCRKIAQVL